jgi:hypothetical protein
MYFYRYDLWLAGKDLGHHPCDDPKSMGMTIAPPPSAEEFLVNRTNQESEVIVKSCPKCLSKLPCCVCVVFLLV